MRGGAGEGAMRYQGICHAHDVGSPIRVVLGHIESLIILTIFLEFIGSHGRDRSAGGVLVVGDDNGICYAPAATPMHIGQHPMQEFNDEQVWGGCLGSAWSGLLPQIFAPGRTRQTGGFFGVTCSELWLVRPELLACSAGLS